MEKTKNCWVTPTDKPSRLWTNNLRRRLELDEFPEQHPNQIAKHIYITSDEEIKEGDWVYVKTPNIYGGNVVARCLSFGKHCWSENILTATTDEKGYHPSHCVKIIMTTDQDLIKDGVQAIPDEFLEWYVKNPSCDEVKVVIMNKGYDSASDFPYQEFYKIIIPKEEPTEEAKQRAENYMSLKGALEPKQETLEEAAEKEYPIKIESIMEGYHDVNSYQRNAFIKGAKLAQETMYSEEEVLKLLNNLNKHTLTLQKLKLGNSFNVKEWFEQFKKK